ncbi:vacuolar protein sorting/targeting protein PEP1 [Ceratocystis pirilliformis]|uniref:Vacuolar protein sorting/targeting protein 10 n=1 Tax=Ceratocystis pirilliformis TaxID=259994 RepID=A0ABR3YZH6_9PEZI
MRLGQSSLAWAIVSQLLAASVVLPGFAAAKSDSPTVHTSTFSAPPENINYFKGSNTLLFHDVEAKNIYKSSDGGDTWTQLTDVPDGIAYMLIMHKFHKDRAFIISGEREHWQTFDKGQTWSKFDSGAKTSGMRPGILHFHASDPDRIIFDGMKCESIFCDDVAMYTTNSFKDIAAPLRVDNSGCWWAKSTPEFTTGSDELDAKRIMCVVRDFFSPFKEDQRLFYSDNFFETHGDTTVEETEIKLHDGKDVVGVVNLAMIKKFILAATASVGTDEMGLYVSDDSVNWHRAMFPTSHNHRVNQEAYTILESTNYSIQVDIMTTRPSNPMGVLFTSNSNGTYFTENSEHTNRNIRGNVDFTKVGSIEGVYVINTVENWEEVEKEIDVSKNLITSISFDDGRTFEKLVNGNEKINLHLITDSNKNAPEFSNSALGVFLANGNIGTYLSDIKDSNLFASADSGATWNKALSGPHMWAFGDQGSVLIAVDESNAEDVSEFSYSLNYGETWKQVKLPNDIKMQPQTLFGARDSSTLKFILKGHSDAHSKYHVISIDFESLLDRTCDENDMEDWHARPDKDGKPTCIMGAKQTYRRRKKDADCFVRKPFSITSPSTEACDCTDADFECDYNFVREDGKCVMAGQIIAPDGVCKDRQPDAVFKGSSGWRLIPGNQCKRPEGSQKDDLVDRKCKDSTDITIPSDDDNKDDKGNNSGPINNDRFVFDTQLKSFDKLYLERGESSSQDDETVIVRPYGLDNGEIIVEDKVWLTTDQGKTWTRILKDYMVHGIFPHSVFKDVVFMTASAHSSTDTVNKVIYTIDRGLNWHEFDLPHPPISGKPFSFHPDKKDWIIFVGEVCEEVNGNCMNEAFLSVDRGDHWKTIGRQVHRCEFTGHSAYKYRNQKQIVCLSRESEDDSPLRLVVSNDFFSEDIQYPKLTDKNGADIIVRQFATMSEFIVVAAEVPRTLGHLLAFASIDGENYAQAHFPFNFNPEHSNEYTVLDSSTHAVNLFVATSINEGHERGNIIKSNSNGTSYVLSLADVNCNMNFFVDYEKIPSVEGLAIANIVANPNKPKEEKKVRTKVTHNDGAEWMYMAPPAKDVDGKSFGCNANTGTEKCALHLHHYTERADKRRGFSVPTAPGILFGIGNVGSYLEGLDKADTYMSSDGGISWRQVRKGIWTYEFGDQGSLLVLIQMDDKIKTNTLLYSNDEGATWTEHQFQEEEAVVTDITTLRSGTSRSFLIWTINSEDQVASTRADFSGLAIHGACTDDDYDVWRPRHPMLNNDCLFGHVSQYLRKKPGRKCFNDQQARRTLESLDCKCTRRDFECDYNFEMDKHGQCSLVPGREPQSAQDYCSENPDAVAFYKPSGYRRIPLTTCVGGEEYDKVNTPIACPGHEEEFKKVRSTSGVVLFFAIIISIGLAVAAGAWVQRNWHRKFGQIRLGEIAYDDDDDEYGLGAPWVRYPVMAISATVAVLATLPMTVQSLWRSATSAYQQISGGSSSDGLNAPRFTTRDSFSRGAPDYGIADDDEGELFGDDSDDA